MLAPSSQDEQVLIRRTDTPVCPPVALQVADIPSAQLIPAHPLERLDQGLQRSGGARPELPDRLGRLRDQRAVALHEPQVEVGGEHLPYILLAPPVVRLARPWLGRLAERGHDCLVFGVRAPRDEAEATSRPADARELAGDGVMIRGEDDADGRGDDVEGRIFVRQVLAVADVKADCVPLLGCHAPRRLDEPRREVESDDVGASAGGADGDGARAGRDVEPALPGTGGKLLDEVVMQGREGLGDALPRSRAPDDALAGLYILEAHRFASSALPRAPIASSRRI